MNVRKKLTLGFSVIVLLLCVIGLIASTNFRNLKNQFTAMENIISYGVLAMKDIETNANKTYQETMTYILFDDTGAKDAALEYLTYLLNIETHYFSVDTLDAENFKSDVVMATKIMDLDFAINTLINKKESGASESELVERNRTVAMPALIALQEEVNERKTLYSQQITLAQAEFNDTYSSSLRSLIIIISAIVLIAMAGAIIVTRSIVRPLHALHVGTDMIAKGNFNYKVGTNARDEIGQLSRSFDRMMESLSTSMTSIDKLNEQINERKQAEATMRASEEKFAKAFRGSPAMMSITTRKDGKFVEVNDTFTSITGYTRKEVTGHTTNEMGLWAKEEDRDRMLQMLKENGSISGEEFDFRMKSGEIRTWLFSTEQIDVDKEPCLIVMALDITERKQMEQTIGDSEEKFSRAFHAFTDAVSIATLKDGVFLEVNDNFITLNGYTREEIIGHTSKEINVWVNPKDRFRIKELMKKRGRFENEEFILQRKSGEMRTVLLSAETINVSGKRCILTIGKDITERKQMEQQLQQHTEELEEANRKLQELDKMKDSFLSTVSHELRTPLTSIKSFAEILLTYDEDKETQREFLGIINQESDRLTKLINDFLDLSKIEAGRMQWEDSEQSLVPIVQNAIKITQALAKEKNLKVEFNPPENLPIVSCDKDRLVQVVTNLLSNSIKFTPGKGKITVGVKEAETNGSNADSRSIVVSVTDSGIGISPENYEVVFEKFKQVGDTLTDKPKGTGLGLPICREIIEHYGGKIWVESEVDKGSTFSFTLPIVTSPEEKIPTPEVMEACTEDNMEGRMILVVDDEDNIRTFLNHELTKRGYCVLEAANGKEALQLSREHHPDLITLDIQMPDINGYDVTTLLKNDEGTKNIPILVLSVIEDKDKLYQLGANDCMTKPFNNEELVARINQLLVGAKKTVLIVDDDRALVKSVKFHLEHKGYSTYSAYDGVQALEIVKNHCPDLIVLDVVMPNMDGFEVIKALKSSPETADIRIVLVTGIDIDGGRVKALSVGANEYVPKSGDFNKLYEAVDNILGSKVVV